MIKLRTLGMNDHAVTNPVIKLDKDIANYSFVTVDGDLYLIMNTVTGDDAYVDDVVIKAGNYLNGYLMKTFASQEIVADAKHIAFAAGKGYDDIQDGNNATLFTVNEDGKLAIAASAPASGVYFKCTGKTALTGNAVILKVMA